MLRAVINANISDQYLFIKVHNYLILLQAGKNIILTRLVSTNLNEMISY